MTEEPSPPPLPPTIKANIGRWWFAWIFATVIIPGSALSLLAGTPADKNAGQLIVSLLVVGGVAWCLQVVSSIKLGKNGSTAKTALLIFGGSLLIVVSFFAGCLVMIGLS